LKRPFRPLAALILLALGTSPSLADDASDCAYYARTKAYYASRQGQVLGGGAIGSLAGLAIGSIAGAAGAGAAIGAGIGMIGGGLLRAKAADPIYQDAYDDCMADNQR
jgi:hypothetical protein